MTQSSRRSEFKMTIIPHYGWFMLSTVSLNAAITAAAVYDTGRIRRLEDRFFPRVERLSQCFPFIIISSVRYLQIYSSQMKNRRMGKHSGVFSEVNVCKMKWCVMKNRGLGEYLDIFYDGLRRKEFALVSDLVSGVQTA